MKSKIWLFHIPLVAFFAFAFWVHEAGIQGRLYNKWLREKAWPVLVQISGLHTNLKFRTRGPEKPKNNIVVVTIDDDALHDWGRWPWHRDMTKKLIERIFESGAKFVGLDITFSEPDYRVPDELKQVLLDRKIDLDTMRFETDLVMKDFLDFASPQICLGWMAPMTCNPLYEGKSADYCPIEDKDSYQIPPRMAKFAIPKDRVHSPVPVDVTRMPLRTVIQALSNVQIFDDSAFHSGFLDVIPDGDGYIRRAPLVFAGADGNFYPSLDLAMAETLLDEKLELQLDDSQMIKSLRFSKSGREIPLSPLGMMDVNFRGGAKTFQYVSAAQILVDRSEMIVQKSRGLASIPTSVPEGLSPTSGVVEVKREDLFKDAIVFIGLDALGVNDVRSFPFEAFQAGVEGHANILDNLLSGDMLRHGTDRHGTIWLLILMTVGVLLFAYGVERLESVPALLLFVGVMAGGWAIDQKVLFEHGSNWNTSLFAIELALVFMLTIAAKYVLEEQNKKFIRTAFGKFVSPAVIDSIMKDRSKLTVGGEKKDLTILFSDIRSFTSFSEKMDAKLLSTFLNEYLGRMTDIVFDTEGTLDKYIGDAVMAFWGAPLDQPKHAANACNAAIQMQKALRQMRPYFKQKYDVEVNVGIGINSGAVSVGNMGSERIFEYTVIGDHVNLASRMEGLTKDYHSSILTSRHTFELIERSGEPVPAHRVLDFVKVKGKKVAVELIQILEAEYNPEGLDAFQSGREHYGKQEWDAAIAQFEIAGRTFWKDGSPDAMSAEFIERCKEFKIDPPGADWDGAWVMKTK